jgi:outer membrane protein TolC
MKRVILILSLFMLWLPLMAQSGIEEAVRLIEANNKTLAALRAETGAQVLESQTGLFPPGPELGFAYLWGHPESLGPRKNLSLMQSFDFPTAYGHRSRIAGERRNQLEAAYAGQWLAIRLEATLLCLELVHANALGHELKARLEHARELQAAWARKLEAGDASLLDYNKASLNFLDREQAVRRHEIERERLLAELRRLNGGMPLELTDDRFPDAVIPADFESWFEAGAPGIPLLQQLRQEVEISKMEEKLQRAQNLPSLSAGYTSEALTHEGFRGVAVGVSIPLWENKNTLRLARARTLAAEEIRADGQLYVHNSLKALHAEALDLQKGLEVYRQGLGQADHMPHLDRALKENRISLLQYLTEISYYYQSKDRMLRMELDLHRAVARLKQYQP